MTLLGSEHSILIRSKFRSVLQFRLQQRRTRETVAEPGSMPLNHGKLAKQEDSYAFEEDSSSESLSPEHHSDESQSSACPTSEPGLANALASPHQTGAREPPDLNQDDPNSSQTTPPIPVPAIVKSKSSDKNRHKKAKDVKPKVKKLKYHQYIPPDQKGEKSPPPMDSAYARLLQQQQLFLQLQILSQQKHSHNTQQNHQHHGQGPLRQPAFSYQPHPPPQNHKGPSEQSSCSSAPSNAVNSNSSSPVKNTFSNQSNISPLKPGPLPANLDDLKVSELRQHLRMRGMPVSGTKTALIDRLRPFIDPLCGSSPASSDITTVTFPVTPSGSLSSGGTLSQGGYYPYPSTSSSSAPVSPASSELSLNGSLPDSFSDVPMSSPTHFGLQPSPGHLEDGARGDGVAVEAEKDKMLVEKQKVIEELTWKLHQEQRQVEELKMQLHKRKRCYGSTQDPRPHPSIPQHSPSLMGQHFFGVTVKQEPMPLSSSCPLASPKQKSPGCMEEMGHCMGSMGGAQCLDPHSGSPSNMSAFLSPQCSPQDSPAAKTSSSPQPPSPHGPYLLTPPLGREGCAHPNAQGGNRPCTMQMQQKNGPRVNCSYPSDQRSVQGVYPNSDCGLNHIPVVKSENMPKQLNRSQQMDELFDVLIENGGCPGLLVPRFHRHYEHLFPNQLPYDHSTNHMTDGHLETLLSAPIGRGAEGAYLKMTNEDVVQGEEGYASPQQRPHMDKLGPELQGMVSMAFSDAPWESMEWLDLTPPTSATAYSVPPPSAPSIFNTEFLDVTDINLSSAMDLHLDHW